MTRRPGAVPCITAPRRHLISASARGGQRGMVTVELAIGFVTVTLLTAVLCGVVLLGVAQATAARTSSEVARQLARGDQVAADRAEAEAPSGTVVRAQDVEEGVEVTATVPVDVLGIGVVPVRATSWARYESGAAP